MPTIYKEQDVLAKVDGLSLQTLRIWVKEGWISPARGPAGKIYRDVDIARIRLIRQLRKEMEVNYEAIPIVLSLLDQIYGLRQEMRDLLDAVDAQPSEVRSRMVDHLKGRRGS